MFDPTLIGCSCYAVQIAVLSTKWKGFIAACLYRLLKMGIACHKLSATFNNCSKIHLNIKPKQVAALAKKWKRLLFAKKWK